MSSGTSTDQGSGGEGSPPAAASGTETKNHQSKGSRYKGRHNNANAKNRGSSKISTFKGATAEIAEHVFLCHAESEKRGNLKDIINGIKTWVMTEFKSHAEHARTILEDGKEPSLPEPDYERDYGYNFDKLRKKYPKYQDVDSDDKEHFEEACEKMVKNLHKLGFQEDIKNWRKDRRNLSTFKSSLFTIIWGQCSDLMKSKLEATKGHDGLKTKHDVVKLLANIKAITNQIDSTVHPFVASDESKGRLYRLRQSDDEKLSDFYKRFNDCKDIVEHYGEGVDVDHKLIEYTKDNYPHLADPEAATKDRVEAMRFLRSTNRAKYGALLIDLKNEFMKGRDVYPTDLTHAYEMVQSFRAPPQLSGSRGRNNNNNNNSTSSNGAGNHGLQFAADGSALVLGRGANKMYPYVKCAKCNRFGHYANKCPTANAQVDDNVQAFMQDIMDDDFDDDDVLDFVCCQVGTPFVGSVLDNQPHFDFSQAVLIDSGSTVSVFKDSSLLTNIHNSDSPLRVRTNGGVHVSTQRATLPGFFDVWYNPSSMLNILSLSDVCGHFKITMDTSIRDSLCVTMPDGTLIHFDCVQNGLYMADFSNRKVNEAVSAYMHNSFVTVNENKSTYTRREIEGADRARALFKHIGYPSYQHLLHCIQHNVIKNCNVTTDDVRRALIIYGPDVAALRGKTTRSPTKHVPPFIPTPIPPDIFRQHSSTTLCMDFLFVQGLPFLHSISHGYQFRTIEGVSNRSKDTILKGFNNAKKVYVGREITVPELRGDNEFKCIEDDIKPTIANLSSPGEHVPEVERSIKTIKERTRTMIHDLPFHTYPKMMVEGCVYSAVKLLNAMPSQNGVSKTLAPSTLILGLPGLDYNNIMKIRFGLYAQVTLEHNITNDNKPRTEGGIALYPTGNAQGAWYFMSLQSGRKIQARSWKVLPTPQNVIDRVHEIGASQGQKKMSDKCFSFEWKLNEPIFSDEENDAKEDDKFDEIEIKHYPGATQHHDNIVEYENPDHDGEEPNSERNEDMQPTDFENDEIEADLSATNENQSIDFEPQANLDPIPEEPTIMDDVDINDLGEAKLNEADSNLDEAEQEASPPEETPTLEQGATEEDVVESESEDNTSGEIQEPVETTEVAAAKEPERNDVKDKHTYNLRPRKAKMNYKEASRRGWQFTILSKSLKKHQKQPSSPKKLRKLNRMHLEKSSKKQKAPKAICNDIFRRTMHVCMAHKEGFKEIFNELSRGENDDPNEICMNQMTAKRGIKKHGQVAINAILKEYAQLHDLKVFKGIKKDDMTTDQLSKTLRLITLIKEKHCGKIKGRACADGRSQRAYIPKEDAASPTVSLDSLMLSLMIDAKEQRDVATADVAGAFLHGEMDDFVSIKLINEEVDIMCKVDDSYKPFVTEENGKKVMYLQLHKALYGTLRAAIIWYKTFTECLEGLGFKLNDHDPCVANMMVDGKQLTIVWYVDDTKISHVNPETVSWVIKKIEDRFGKMSVTRGKRHTFVGLDFEILPDKRVKILTKDYIQEAIDDFGEDVSDGATSPAANNLFIVPDHSEKLPKEQHDIFHSIVAKLLFVTKRSRLDIGLAIAFLCTRVAKSTTSDWDKLKRLLKYLYRTINMPRILGADNLSMIKTWVDAAYAIHPDMRSHTGGVISFGHGACTTKSSKQKLNTKSSTESEVVGASDYVSWPVWIGWFMKAQGYPIDTSIFYQDNQSAIRMEKNGRQSCGEKSRHINIRYFFIKDIIKRENIKIEYCPTEEMVADFYTKPLQGKQFQKFCEFIMGIKFNEFELKSREERVEDNQKSQDLKTHDSNSNKNDHTNLVQLGNNKNLITKISKETVTKRPFSYKQALLNTN